MLKRTVFERSRRELSLDVSVGVHILLVVEQSSLESQSTESWGMLRRSRCVLILLFRYLRHFQRGPTHLADFLFILDTKY